MTPQPPRGICPNCGQKTLEYENAKCGGSYIDTIECPCGWFTNSRQSDYDRVHRQAFPLTLSEKADRRLAASFSLPAGALPVAVGGERP